MQAVEKESDTSLRDAQLVGEAPPGGSTVRASGSIWRRIRRDVVLLGAGSLGTVVSQLVFRSILIAVLVPLAYGRLSLVLSVYNTAWIIGAGGLPSGVARYVAAIAPADDSPVVRTALRGGVWPAGVAAVFVGTISAVILGSPLAFLYGALGLCSFVYAMILMGILRGRGQIGQASAVMPIGGVGEVIFLAMLVVSGLAVTPVSVFGVFCAGNVLGLTMGIAFVFGRSRRGASKAETVAGGSVMAAPSARQLLGFSMWLGLATVGIAILPLTVRFAAALNSYTTAAIVDVALVLLSIPLRMGSIIVSAVVPHATRAVARDEDHVTISAREQLIVVAPFVLGAIVVVSTNVVGITFDLLGRSEYAKSAVYLALALLAGPPRILYGLVEGVLVARGEGRFLATNSLSITALTSVGIVLFAALGSMVGAFALFVAACWAVYLFGFTRIRRLSLEGT